MTVVRAEFRLVRDRRRRQCTGTVGFDGLTGSAGAGSLCLDSSTQVVYNSGSDSCLSSTRDTKHDIAPLSLDDLAIVSALEPVSFVYNAGDGRERYGFIAEDAAAVDTHVVTYDASGAISGIDRSILRGTCWRRERSVEQGDGAHAER